MRGVILCIALLMVATMTTPLSAGDSTFVERAAAGMQHWKMSAASGKWWSCGVPQEEEEVPKIATELASLIENEANEHGLNPWGLAGIMAKESKFDECAIGKKSRDLGYDMGILKRNRLTISHTAEDVLKVIGSKRWKKELGKADMGLPQVMYPTIYKGDPAALLTRPIGVQFAAAEMVRRIAKIGSYVKVAIIRPWGTWPGWYDSDYDDSIVRYARALGATEQDISTRLGKRSRRVKELTQ